MLQVKSHILAHGHTQAVPQKYLSRCFLKSPSWDLFPSPLMSVMQPALSTTETHVGNSSGPSVASVMYTAATGDSQPSLVLLLVCSQQKLGLPELKVSFPLLSVGPAKWPHAVGLALSPEVW